jgi:fatty acid desaturase
MGDAKRRKDALGDDYGKEGRLYPWLPFTKTQAQQFMKISSTGAWIGIIAMIAAWIVVRFVGPYFGWWEVN